MQITVLRVKPVTPRDALNELVAAGFKVGSIDEEVLASAPLFKTTEVDYVFDQLREPEKLILSGEVDNIFEEKYGCKHIPDFVGVCATLVVYPTLVDARPIAIQWLDGNGHFCCTIWFFWSGERFLNVYRFVLDWFGNVRFPRARK